MKIFIVILLSPVIFIASIFMIFEYVLPLKREIDYFSNRERTCQQRADPVRIKINSRYYTIPADIFDGQSLAWCWGFYTASCTNSQTRKSFYDQKNGKETTGFCQKDSDPPFTLKGINLFFERYSKNALKIKLSATNLPEIDYELKKLSLMHIQRWSLSDYCSKADNNSPKIFGYPVIFECNNKLGENLLQNTSCSLKGLVSDDVYFFLTGRFSIAELPPEYWSTFVENIEDVITDMMKEKPSIPYPQICMDVTKK